MSEPASQLALADRIVPVTAAIISLGQVTLVAGTATVSFSAIAANSRILLTVETPGGVQGILSYTKIVGTSFTINSTSVLDTSVVNWLIVESR